MMSCTVKELWLVGRWEKRWQGQVHLPFCLSNLTRYIFEFLPIASLWRQKMTFYSRQWPQPSGTRTPANSEGGGANEVGGYAQTMAEGPDAGSLAQEPGPPCVWSLCWLCDVFCCNSLNISDLGHVSSVWPHSSSAKPALASKTQQRPNSTWQSLIGQSEDTEAAPCTAWCLAGSPPCAGFPPRKDTKPWDHNEWVSFYVYTCCFCEYIWCESRCLYVTDHVERRWWPLNHAAPGLTGLRRLPDEGRSSRDEWQGSGCTISPSPNTPPRSTELSTTSPRFMAQEPEALVL